jgi:hypothetical protein
MLRFSCFGVVMNYNWVLELPFSLLILIFTTIVPDVAAQGHGHLDQVPKARISVAKIPHPNERPAERILLSPKRKVIGVELSYDDGPWYAVSAPTMKVHRFKLPRRVTTFMVAVGDDCTAAFYRVTGELLVVACDGRSAVVVDAKGNYRAPKFSVLTRTQTVVVPAGPRAPSTLLKLKGGMKVELPVPPLMGPKGTMVTAVLTPAFLQFSASGWIGIPFFGEADGHQIYTFSTIAPQAEEVKLRLSQDSINPIEGFLLEVNDRGTVLYQESRMNGLSNELVESYLLYDVSNRIVSSFSGATPPTLDEVTDQVITYDSYHARHPGTGREVVLPDSFPTKPLYCTLPPNALKQLNGAVALDRGLSKMYYGYGFSSSGAMVVSSPSRRDLALISNIPKEASYCVAPSSLRFELLGECDAFTTDAEAPTVSRVSGGSISGCEVKISFSEAESGVPKSALVGEKIRVLFSYSSRKPIYLSLDRDLTAQFRLPDPPYGFEVTVFDKSKRVHPQFYQFFNGGLF